MVKQGLIAGGALFGIIAMYVVGSIVCGYLAGYAFTHGSRAAGGFIILEKQQ